MEKKKCNTCGLEKPVSEFHKRGGKENGYRSKCKECYSSRRKIYRDDNKERAAEYSKEYRKNNPEKIKEARKKWLEENPDYYLYYGRKYFEDNKEIILKKQREYRRKNKNIDTIIKNRVRARIWQSVTKTGSTIEYLGCDIEFYKQYLENLFAEGMSWDNYGEWEIDHIKPIKLFNLETEVFEAFHYSNTQPLWKEDNRRKSVIYENN